MDPLNHRLRPTSVTPNIYSTQAAFNTSPTSTLLPLVNITPGGEVKWNFDQNPDLLSEENYENDLLKSLQDSVKDRGDPIRVTTVKNLKVKFTKVLDLLKRGESNPTALALITETLEEILCRDDLDLKTDINDEENEDFFQVESLGDCLFEVQNDHQAYSTFLLYVFSNILSHHSLPQKLLTALKNYKKTSCLDFIEKPLVKKLSLLLLTRAMNASIVINIVNKELDKINPQVNPAYNNSLLRIKNYLEGLINESEMEERFRSNLHKHLNDKNYVELSREFQRFIDSKPEQFYCVSNLSVYTEQLMEAEEKTTALELCELALKLYPTSKALLKIKKSICNSRDKIKTEKKVAGLTAKLNRTLGSNQFESPLDKILNLPAVNVIADVRKTDFQTKLTPLFKEGPTGFIVDFDQNDWLLDKDTFAYRLNESFAEYLKKKYPDFKIGYNEKPKFSSCDLKIIIHKNGFIDISQTYLSKIIPNNNGAIEITAFFNYLYLNEFYSELDYFFSYFAKATSKNLFSYSQRNYMMNIKSLRTLVDGDEIALMYLFKEFETFSQNLHPKFYPFLEKLKILTTYRGSKHFKTVNFQWTSLLNLIDVLIQKTKVYGHKNCSLDLLKAEIFVLAGSYEEARIQLINLPSEDKEKRSYFKTLCSLAFNEGAWTKAQEAGEQYFGMRSGNILEMEDLNTAYILSTIYRYNQTLGDEKLFLGLIETLHTSQKTFYPSEFVHLFYNIAFNCYFNPAAVKFKDHKISFIENEHPLMKSCKETLVYMIAKTSANKESVREAIGISQTLFNEITGDKTIETRPDAELIADVLLTKALTASRDNLNDFALFRLNQIDNIAPYQLEAHCVKAQILMIQNKDREALDIISNCIQLTTRFYPEWVVIRMNALIKLGLSELAFFTIQDALKKEPNNLNLLIGEVHALQAMDRSENFEKAKAVLNRDMSRNDRIGIIRMMIASNFRSNRSYLQDQLSRLIDNSGDYIQTEAYYTKCLLHLMDGNILEATNDLAEYGQKDYIGLYLETGIEITRKNYNKALEILKNCQKLKSSANKDSTFLVGEIDIKNYEFEIYAKLGRFEEILNGRMNWFSKGIPDLSLLAYLDKIILACRKLNKLEIGLKVCEKLLRVYPKNNLIKKAKEIMINEIAELPKKVDTEIPVQNDASFLIVTKKPNTSLPSEETPANQIDIIPTDLFVFSKKPALFVKQIKATIKEGPDTMLPVHPALKKLLEAEIKQAKVAVAEMFQSDNTQKELGKSYKTIFAEEYGPFAEYEKEEKEVGLADKLAPKPPTDHPKPAAKPVAKAPAPAPSSRLGVETPKRMTKSIEVASRELGLEIPIKFDSLPYEPRFSGAHRAVNELTDNLALLLKPNAQIHPIYKNEEFASRYLYIQLFRLAELLKPTKKGLTSQEGFKFFVHQIFRECRDVVQLRNLITLYGHRTAFQDLTQFCQYIVKSRISENLLCVSQGKKPVCAPLEFDLKKLFPVVFQQEWMRLNPFEQKIALYEIIDFELEFVSKLIDVAKPDLFENKGVDVCEVIKLSVLRIGKALSHIKLKLKIPIFDPELIALIEASKKVRHQITKPNVIGLPRELQPRWLSAFMMGSIQMRERIKNNFNIL